MRGLQPGPAPAHPIGIWLGVGKPRAPALKRRIDEAAAVAGRDPSAIRRVYNIGGTIADGPTHGLLKGPPEHWVETLTRFAGELGFDTFVSWPDEEPLVLLQRFAEEVVPALRAPLAR